jgi:hypothetical protein
MLTAYFGTATISEIDHAEIDPDLDPLRADARYRSLIAQAKSRLGVS